MITAANLRLGPANVYIHEKPRATLTTVLTGNNNDLTFTADKPGAGGNAITIAYVNPAAANKPLAVTVVGTAISVQLATDGASAIVSTADQVKDAINNSFAARSLVYAVRAAGNDGSGVVEAMAATQLAGGSDTATPVDVGAMGNELRIVIGTSVTPLTAAQTGDVAQDEVIVGGKVEFTIPFKEIVFDNFARAIPNARVLAGANGLKRLDIVARVGESRRAFAVKMEIRPLIGGVETADPNEIYVIPLATAVAGDVSIPFGPTTQQELPATFRAWPDANGRWMFKGTETL